MSMSNQVQRLTAALGDADGFAGRNVAPSDRQPSRDSYVLEEYGGCEKKPESMALRLGVAKTPLKPDRY